ncbi:TIGR03086 family metal-binding protein [Streptomyces sp. NPDC091292]|uniref:TIGR03086 family metal-binding protein n=1 Tax=Streptomyces sp. NPDC091292 TaxID=3365991 RepID=UPI00380C52BF
MSDLDDLRATTPSAPGAPPLGDLLRASGAQAVPLVRALRDDGLSDPTPCADYDVRSLVNHLFHVVTQFTELARKGQSDFTVTPDYVAQGEDGDGGDDWRERFATAVDTLVDAWSAPGAEEGTTGAMDMPARTVGCMVLLDLTVHVWDLARATGTEYRPDPQDTGVVDTLTGAVAGLAPTARAMGMFADPVPVAADASAFDLLLGTTGRDPHWQRP